MRRRHGGTGLHSLSTCGNDATARCRELFPRCASCGNAGPVQAVALRLKINRFICTVQGKGCFVAEGNQELLRENQLCHIEELLAKAANQAEALGVTRDKLHEMLDLVAPETMQ